MPTALVTGFSPFDGAKRNSSWDAVSQLNGHVTAQLSVEFGRAWQELESLIEQHSPDVVIAVGLAADRKAITPERVAINLEDARIPDNAGSQPRDREVVAGGPAAYFSGLPTRAIVEALRDADIAVEESLSAGAFVCNHVMYRLLHDVATRHPGVVAGFIHVPSEQTMDVATIARGLEVAVRVSLEHSALQK